MLAKLARAVPEGDGWLFEPKWDGFRCIVFRDGAELTLTSRNQRPFDRYFPELRGPLLASLPDRCVVDGEIVVPDAHDRGLDFDALGQRIHPAESRVRRLAAETPASFVAFDLLALDDRSLLDAPLHERHALLGAGLRVDRPAPDPTDPSAPAGPEVHLTPSSTDREVALRWFSVFEGAGLDGVMAKRLDDPYVPGGRTMIKVKHERTADCAVAGYRIHKDGQGVGSLLLGLHDADGRLHHVGVAASFTATVRRQLLAELEPLTHGALVDHPWRDWAEAQAHAEGRLPGGVSRWNADKDLSWVPLRVERVAEVRFGQLEKGRFRHGVSFVRWRPDRDPADCGYEQLDVASPVPFHRLVAEGG
jgi:ATP-dependent DNA ligase